MNAETPNYYQTNDPLETTYTSEAISAPTTLEEVALYAFEALVNAYENDSLFDPAMVASKSFDYAEAWIAERDRRTAGNRKDER